MIKRIIQFRHIVLLIIASLILVVDVGLLFVLRKDISNNNDLSLKREEYILLQSQILTYNKLLNDYNILISEDNDLESKKIKLQEQKEKLVAEEEKLVKEIEKLKQILD